MSSRGRGYGGYNSRGSRGGGFRGSYRGGGSRGSYEGRGGRGGGGYSSYNDSSRYGGGGSRYHQERRDDSYKKPFRPENSYSSREYGGRSGSPERKRMRMEGSSERRSHDGGGHYYGGRQDGYSGERRAYNGEGRRSSASRDGYRKGSEMASGGRSPPRSAPPLRSRVMRAPRRSLRGRPMRTRGYFRGSSRSRPYAVRRYTDRAPMPYTRVYRSLKGRSLTTRAKEDEASSTDGEWDTEDKEPEVEEKKEPKIKSPKEVKVSEEAEVEAAVAAADEAEETEKEGDAASDEGEPAPPFVNLTCVHCKEKYATFSGYTKHLLSSKHRTAMAVVARKHKAVLLRMRVAQRDAQRELEIAGGAKLAPRTAFCPVCRLNHRTTRHAHNLSDTHRAMKRFLTPFCRICRLAFRSPMMYEHHIASIEHLKCKSRQPAHVPSPKADGEEASGDEGMDVDLDNFMTLDSVGDVDEVDDEDSGGEKKEGDEEVKKPKVEINIGSEHVKKIEVYWCELCRVYVGRESPAAVGPAVGPAAAVGQAAGAEALRRHCRLRAHLRRYVQHRDTRTLRKHAERIHRQLHQAKDGGENNEMKVDANADIPKTEKVDETEEKKNVNGTEVALTGNEDKLWADVDKDIGDLLREVDPQVNDGSDDDDDLDRYDKFRKSDKLTDAEDNQPVVAESNVEKKATELNASA